MAGGIRAFGVDGARQQLYQGIQQLLLTCLQALAFDRHGRGAGDGLDKGDAISPQVVLVVTGTTVVQHQQQNAHGFAVAVVQANTDQVDTLAAQLRHDWLQIPRLLKAERMGDAVMALEQPL